MQSQSIPKSRQRPQEDGPTETYLADGSPRAPRLNPYPSWGRLRWLLLFRLGMLVGLMLYFGHAFLNSTLAPDEIRWSWKILNVYAVLVLASGPSLFWRWPGPASQVHLAIYVDIIALTLLMHSAGGVVSGLGMLIAVDVAIGALMMEGRLALLFASFATLAVLTEQFYGDLQGRYGTGSYTQAGLLGATFFALALLSHVLYRRIREARSLAARRTLDIANLTRLNAFIIEHLTTGLVVIDAERHLRLTNRTALSLLSIEQARARTPLAECSPELARCVEQLLRHAREEGRVVAVGERKLRVSLQHLGDTPPTAFLVYLRDELELTREAQQLKLAALGTLTASIAHNIRNPLSAITHAGQLIAEGKGLSEDDQHLLDIIRRNAGRIDEIVRSVLQLSARERIEPVRIDLTAWLPERVAELRDMHRLSEEDCHIELSPMSIRIEADMRHLHQILANLVENALTHGVLAGQKPCLSIRLKQGMGHDRRPLIEVCDKGPGVDPKVVNEIFSPFFTTRASGTGLGLYIARELAQTNAIQISYAPAAPHGSCFRLIFERWHNGEEPSDTRMEST